MPETPSASSTSSSCVSSILFEEVLAVMPPSPRASTDGGGAIKFICSYGGKILPRRHDGKLRYVGGHTRVLTVQRPLSFQGLYKKLRELCGWDAVNVRCQLPTEDMDALVSVTSDDELDSVLDEYDVAAARRNQQLRMIRVFVHPPAGARTQDASRAVHSAAGESSPTTGPRPYARDRCWDIAPRALLPITSSNHITRMERGEEEDVFP